MEVKRQFFFYSELILKYTKLKLQILMHFPKQRFTFQLSLTAKLALEIPNKANTKDYMQPNNKRRRNLIKALGVSEDHHSTITIPGKAHTAGF